MAINLSLTNNEKEGVQQQNRRQIEGEKQITNTSEDMCRDTWGICEVRRA